MKEENKENLQKLTNKHKNYPLYRKPPLPTNKKHKRTRRRKKSTTKPDVIQLNNLQESDEMKWKISIVSQIVTLMTSLCREEANIQSSKTPHHQYTQHTYETEDIRMCYLTYNKKNKSQLSPAAITQQILQHIILNVDPLADQHHQKISSTTLPSNW